MMVTRNGEGRFYENFDKTYLSRKNLIPPWCNSGKLYLRKRRHDSKQREASSTFPIGDNVGEYLHENFEKFNTNKSQLKQSVIKKGGGKGKWILFHLVIMGILASSWMCNKIPKVDLITEVISRTRIMSLLRFTELSGEIEDCRYNIRHLEAQLFKAEQLLRHSIQKQRTKMLPETNEVSVPKNFKKYYIHGAIVKKSGYTKEWGGRMSLWGVVPLWRASRPLNTVLSLKKPTPGDCWPFMGKDGEIIIELPKIYPISCISIEHVHPDTAQSAPKRFVIHGIQVNDTAVKLMDGHFDNNKPTKQYYYLNKAVQVKRVNFRVIANSGNPKYTCIYRIHVYSSIMD